MIETWFISDTHFGHKNILEYEKEHRPFSTVEEMNETIIERWNSVVKQKDTIYHLGDFAFGKKNIEIASRLNGRKHLVMGNHDQYPSNEYLKYFQKLHGQVFWENFILSHVPVHPDCLGLMHFLNVHGHLHSREISKIDFFKFHKGLFGDNLAVEKIKDRNYFNVSCEQNNLTPINADVIRDHFDKYCG